MKKKIQIQKMTLAAVFLAMGLILPFFTGQIPQIGSMLLPMHIPVFVCGMICNGWYGAFVGFLLPLVRYFLFGMPSLYPIGIAMSFELASYGMIAGGVYHASKRKSWSSLYFSLIAAMIGGRIVWGIVFALLCGFADQEFTINIFISTAVINAIPGIVLQIVFVPILVKALNHTELVSDAIKITVK